MEGITKGSRIVTYERENTPSRDFLSNNQQDVSRNHQSINTSSIDRSDENWDFTNIYDALQTRYKIEQAPIEVNFRKLVPFNSGVDRLTHLIHSYPAKLILNIPLFFLRCNQIGQQGHLHDPFCGSGTVLLEGMIRGWRISGADANPLARLISRVKLTTLNVEKVKCAAEQVYRNWQNKYQPFAPILNVNYWFTEEVKRQIGGISAAISAEVDDQIRDFLYVCLSSCVRKASFADPRLSVPVRVAPTVRQWNRANECDVVKMFCATVKENCRRIAKLPNQQRGWQRRVEISKDARGSDGKVVPDGSIDLIMTSPPYVGAQKYVRATSLSLGWLGLVPTGKLRDLEEQSIGREHYKKMEYQELVLPKDGVAHEKLKKIRKKNPLRAHIASNYLSEMLEALMEISRLVRNEGKVVLVIGNNTVAGESFETSGYIKQMASRQGLRLELELVDSIRSRGLMTKRNQTAGIIMREYIQVYSKP